MARLPPWIEEQPQQNIAAILRYVVDLLDEEISRIGRHDRDLARSLGPLLRDAWEEAKPAATRLEGLAYDTSNARLAAHGLTGKQLELKYKLLAYFAEWYQESGDDSVLKQLLDFINKILPSIFGSMGNQTFLDEIKKCLEAIVWGMSRD